MYVFHKDYPRLVGYFKELYHEEFKRSTDNQDGTIKIENTSCSTLISTDKNYKKVMINVLNKQFEKYNLKFVEWDLSACHTKILISLFPKDTPLIQKVFEQDESIWTEFDRFFPEELMKLIGGHTLLK